MAANTKSKVIYLIINSLANKGTLIKASLTEPPILGWENCNKHTAHDCFGSTELSAQLLVGALGE